MSQHPSDLEFGHAQQPQAQQKGWFGRNWKWFVPVVILLPVFCCCGGGGLFLWFAVDQLKDVAPYQDSLTEAQQNAEVQQALGTPIEEVGFVDALQQGFQVSGKQTGQNMDFDASIPIKGSSGTGVLIVEAETSDSGATWTYSVRRVEVNGTGEVIDLLDGTGGGQQTPTGGDAGDDADGDQDAPPTNGEAP